MSVLFPLELFEDWGEGPGGRERDEDAITAIVMEDHGSAQESGRH